MFDKNKFFGDYVEGISVDIPDTVGRCHNTPLSWVVQHQCSKMLANVDGDGIVKYIKAVDAYYEDSDITENTAKALVGSWLQVVKHSKEDDPEWHKETKQFLEDAIKWLDD